MTDTMIQMIHTQIEFILSWKQTLSVTFNIDSGVKLETSIILALSSPLQEGHWGFMLE